MDKIRDYHLEGYMTDGYNNIISNNVVGDTKARSWAEAERNVTYRAKKKLGLANNAYVKFKQTEKQKQNSWRST